MTDAGDAHWLALWAAGLALIVGVVVGLVLVMARGTPPNATCAAWVYEPVVVSTGKGVSVMEVPVCDQWATPTPGRGGQP